MTTQTASSPLCSSNLFFQSSLPSIHRRTGRFRIRARTARSTSSVQLSSLHLHAFRLSLPSPPRVATHETVETAEAQFGFVEIGYISKVHGIQGEIRVKPSTDFPELRFSEPGRRWLKKQVLGSEVVQQIELVDGRGHPGQKSWILKFRGIDTAEQAKQLIGLTLLVREEDRPELEEGEFYTRDLVGMRVVLKESGESVGTVVNVFDCGGSDLLRVMLDCSQDDVDAFGNQQSTDTEVTRPLVWIPFVEAIVPDVDLERREMQITPPKGLLELNLRTDERSKKERRQLEWKERKKFQKHLIAAKKKLCEMDQQHVFHGFRFGEKSQGRLLGEEIVGVNTKLLQLALRDIEAPSKRWTVTELVNSTKSEMIRNTLRISYDCLTSGAGIKSTGENLSLQEKGLQLTSTGKTAVVLVVNEKGFNPDAVGFEGSPLQAVLRDDKRFAKVEDRPLVPLILICSACRIHSIQKLFLTNDQFAFDPNKVWFLEEEKLPVVSKSVEDQNRPKILMKSPWEILQSPVGSGGVFSLLAAYNILDNLSEMGMDYVEICSSSQRYVGMNTILIGHLNLCKADVGIQYVEDTEDFDESFDVIFSMNFIKKLTKQSGKLQFYATPESYSHVEKVEKEWVDIIPSSPNSYRLCSSIYSSLNSCSLDKVCVIEIAEE